MHALRIRKFSSNVFLSKENYIYYLFYIYENSM